MCQEHQHESTCGCGCGHSHSHSHHEHNHSGMHHPCIPMLLSAILLFTALYADISTLWQFCLYVIAYLILGLPLLKEAWHELIHGHVFNEFTLMAIATLGAFAINEYPEAVAVLLFYSAGEYFQARAVGHARRDIHALVSMHPDTATRILANGGHESVKPESIAVGETIEVKVGERVPLDGKLLNQAADFDTAALTGESVPRTLHYGQEVCAGMIATTQVVQIEVIRPYAESTLQCILKQVEEAARHKAPAEKFIRRFARIYTPIVTLLAALIALLPPLITNDEWNVWIYRALVFLVISCPCALVISIPLGYFRGIGMASRKGILFKGGNYLDTITRLHTVVFDKTGTLTTGTFSVTRIETSQNIHTELLLKLAASLERHSTHPLAKAIVAEAQIQHITIDDTADNVHELAGLGLTGTINGHAVAVGKEDLIKQLHITLPVATDTPEASTCVWCAIDGQYAGRFLLNDSPRKQAAETVKRLHNLGINHIALLSGDRRATVSALADELGIDEWHADLLPEQKTQLLSQIKQNHPQGGVAFVGDGINDTPALALSDIGFAIGNGGTDAAIETADVVLQSDNPAHIADALIIGRRTRHIVCLNIALALGVKVVVLLAGVLGMTNLWAAVLADTGIALLCVANTYFINNRNL